MEHSPNFCPRCERVHPRPALGSAGRRDLCRWRELLLCDLLHRRACHVRFFPGFEALCAQNDVTKIKSSSLAVCGLAYVFAILLLPKWGNYSIRQFLEKLPDGAQATRLVKVPNAELAKWDATHDEHGDVVDRKIESPSASWCNIAFLQAPAHSLPHSPGWFCVGSGIIIVSWSSVNIIHYVSVYFCTLSHSIINSGQLSIVVFALDWLIPYIFG